VALRTVGIRLTAEISQYTGNLRRAAAATKDFGGQLDKASKAGQLDAVADRAGVAGLALVGLAGYAVKSAADFDKSMSAVSAATHAGTKDMDALRKAALQAGKDTQYSATGAANAITELSKAGVSTADILNGGLKGALSLAAAGQLDVGEAAETAASAMTQFKLTGDKIPHVADLLAAAAGKAQGSVHDMGAALNQSGLVAAQFGLSIEDTTGVLAEFAHAGLVGSDAGTSLKTMLLALANPSLQSRNLMDQLGISFYDATGKFIGMSGVAQVLQTRLKGLTVEQRNQALGQIFGNDAIRAASILYTDGAAGVQKWAKDVNSAGYASETAAKLTDNLAGDLERLKGSVETLAIESGSGANGGLRDLVKILETAVDQFGRMPSVVSKSLIILAGVGGIAAIALAAFIKLRKGLAEAVTQLTAMGPAGAKAAGGLQKAAGAAGKAAAAFAILEAASGVFNSLDQKTVDVGKLTAALDNLGQTGKTTGELKDVFGDNWDKLGRISKFANSASDGLGHFVKQVANFVPIAGDAGVAMGNFATRLAVGTDLDTATQQMAGLDESLSQYITTTNDARKASDLWNQVLSKSGLNTEQLAKLLPNTWKELAHLNAQTGIAGQKVSALGTESEETASQTGDLNSALGRGKEAQKEYATVAEAAAAAARGERAAFVQLSSAMKAQLDPVFGFIESQKALAKAQKAAKDAQKELDAAIDKHGPKSSQAKAATDKLRGATRDLASAAVDLQGKTGELGQSFNGKLTPSMINTFKAAGLTDRQIKDVAKQFRDARSDALKYDDKYEARISAPGVKQAKKEIDQAYSAGKQYDGRYIARLTVDGYKPVSSKLDSLLVRQRALATGLSVTSARAAVQKDLDRNRLGAYSAGGWTGPGGTYDEAGIVHADEFVIKKESRRKIEATAPGLLDEMNATGQAPGYAGGGHVMKFRTTAARTDIPSWSEVASKIGGNFGNWPRSPAAQRGDSGVWHKILALVKGSGIPYQFGNAYRPGDPLWHGSGRAIDFMGYNQDRLANFFLARQSQVLELIHRTRSRDYGITRGHYNAMPHQWPLHRNHLHIAMNNGGTITEPVMGVGASGRTYSFGENFQPERVVPNWQPAGSAGGNSITVVLENHGVIGSRAEVDNWLTGAVDRLRSRGRV
jgi:TP901 family phage tail tape measure protein